MAELSFVQVDVDATPITAGQYAQANSSYTIVFANRARKISDGTYACWHSNGAKDTSMASYPGHNPADYTDFVVTRTFWIT